MKGTRTSTEDSDSYLPDPPSNFNAENTLSEELLKLSFRERQNIEEEIHGVRCGARDETPTLVEESLQLFDDKINARKRQAESSPEEDERNVGKLLRNIVQTNLLPRDSLSGGDKEILPDVERSCGTLDVGKRECYLNRDDIRLRFIRCDCFDVDKAVQRLINFLDLCSEMFGPYVCERELRLSDFNTRKEETALRNSRVQFLPFRDRSGRRVLMCVGDCNHLLDCFLKYKIAMFQFWCASEDIETQRKGIVSVLWPYDENEKEDSDRTWETMIRPSLRKDTSIYKKKSDIAMPVRVISRHMYFKDTPFYHALSALYFFVLSTEDKLHYKSHSGEPIELLYTLGSYGIATDLVPVSCTGVVKSSHMNAWLNYQRAHEQNIKSGNDVEEMIDCPRSNDVIFRKGTTFRSNPGNTYYRMLIEKYSIEHANGDRKLKCDITLRIIDEVQERAGRFLEWSREKKIWVLIKSRDRVRRKIAAAFKQFVRAKKRDGYDFTLPLFDTLKQLDSSIDDAARVLGTRPRGNEFHEMPSLPDYKSMTNVGKRQKLAIFSACGGDDSCFGKYFHTTD